MRNIIKKIVGIITILAVVTAFYGCADSVFEKAINVVNVDDYIKEIKNGDRKPIEIFFDAIENFPSNYFISKLYNDDIWVDMMYDDSDEEKTKKLINDDNYFNYQIQSVFISEALDEYIKEFKKSSYKETLPAQIKALENINKIYYQTHFSDYDDDWDGNQSIIMSKEISKKQIMIGGIAVIIINCKNGDNYCYNVYGGYENPLFTTPQNKAQLLKKYNNLKTGQWNGFNQYDNSMKRYRYYEVVHCGLILNHKIKILNEKNNE